MNNKFIKECNIGSKIAGFIYFLCILICPLSSIAAAYDATDELLGVISRIDKDFVRDHHRSKAGGLSKDYTDYFDKEAAAAAPELDITDLSRRARVIFFARCLNINIKYLYTSIPLAEEDSLPMAKDLRDLFKTGGVLESKFMWNATNQYFYQGKKVIKIKFGDLRGTITPNPTHLQYGNCFLTFEGDIPTRYTTGDKKGLIDIFDDFDDVKKTAALNILKGVSPATDASVGEKLGVDGKDKKIIKNNLNALSLLFELEISRRYIYPMGQIDKSLSILPFATTLHMASSLTDLINCFKGTDLTARKNAVKSIVAPIVMILKSPLLKTFGGASESEEVEDDD